MGIKNQLQFLLHFFILILLLGLPTGLVLSMLYDFHVSDLNETLSVLEVPSLVSITMFLMGVLYAIQLSNKKKVKSQQGKSFLQQSLFVIVVMVILYIYGQQDRFWSGAHPVEDLLDFSFILVLVLMFWRLSQIIFSMFEAKRDSLGKPLFIAARGLVLLLAIVPLDILLNYLFLNLVYGLPLYEDYFVLEVPLKALIVLLVNFLDEVIQSNSQSMTEAIQIKVRIGNKHKFIAMDQIAYFMVSNQVTYLYTVTSEKFITDLTLAQLENELIGYDFFRANRQLLIARNAVEGYKTAKDKKIELSLSGNGSPTTTYYISRLGAPSFRRWIKHELGTVHP